jgi:uncharacterized membrane protein
MTPENKKVVKIIAVSVGIILVLSVITVLIVKQVEKNRAKREAEKNGVSDGGDSKPSASSSSTSGGGSSTSSFGGRTFSKTEIEKMQSYLFNIGAMAMNETIVSAIRDSGGIDGKIGNGFKTAYNEALRVGFIKSLDDLYTQAMKH